MFHLRFTPDDISGYTFNFLDKFEKFIVAQEDVDDNGSPLLHFHILIDTTYGIKTIRDSAKEFLRIPASGKGKNNKYYALFDDWKDPGYICKYDNIIKSKGYSDKEIMDYAIAGKIKYLGSNRTSEARTIAEPQTKEKVIRVPYQQAVIAEAGAKWYNYKREQAQTGEYVDKNKLVLFVCEGMRTVSKGINPYMVKELALAVLFDDLDYRDFVLNKIRL